MAKKSDFRCFFFIVIFDIMSYQYVRIRAWAWPGHTLSNKPMLLLHEAIRRSDEHRSCSLGSSGCGISATWNNFLFSGCDSGMAKESNVENLLLL